MFSPFRHRVFIQGGLGRPCFALPEDGVFSQAPGAPLRGSAAVEGWSFRSPVPADAAAILALIRACPPLEPNSCYAYLLLCQHFSGTCVVAEKAGSLLGFLSAYLPPDGSDRVFCWQVAVHPQARGQKLGLEMLRELLRRPKTAEAAYLEATVGPSNQASAALFRSLARTLTVSCEESVLFDRKFFGQDAHEDEMLFRIGPFRLDSTPSKEDDHGSGNFHEA